MPDLVFGIWHMRDPWLIFSSSRPSLYQSYSSLHPQFWLSRIPHIMHCLAGNEGKDEENRGRGPKGKKPNEEKVQDKEKEVWQYWKEDKKAILTFDSHHNITSHTKIFVQYFLHIFLQFPIAVLKSFSFFFKLTWHTCCDSVSMIAKGLKFWI